MDSDTLPAVPRAQFCVSCGASRSDGTRFCTHCGHDFDGVISASDHANGHPNAPIPSSRALPSALPSARLFGGACASCGGAGARLAIADVYCPACRWLRPLHADYDIPVETFLWQLDADAMRVLASLGPLTAAAHAVSERVGRPWLEASVNGVRLGPRVLPDVFALAIRAARIMALPYLPEIYVSGEQMWDAISLGTESSAFIVIGSVLTTLPPDRLLFMLGREMGHCRAGHALWRTVSQFLSGKSHARRTILGDGVMNFLNPAKLVENAIDAPLMAWARHSEITADRAGLLVVGNEQEARKVLMASTLRSLGLPDKIDADAWREQEDASDDVTTRIAEMTMSSVPYLGGRLKLLRQFCASDTYSGWRAVIEHWLPSAPPPPTVTATASATTSSAPSTSRTSSSPIDNENVSLECPTCHESMRVARAQLESRDAIVYVRCPNPACKGLLSVRPVREPTPAPPAAAPPAAVPPEPVTPPRPLLRDTLPLSCPNCSEPMRIPMSALTSGETVYVRCLNHACGKLLTVRDPSATAAPAPRPDTLTPE